MNRQELLKIGSQKAGGRVGQMKTYQLPSMHAAGHTLDLGISFLGGILVKAGVWCLCFEASIWKEWVSFS